MLKQLLQACFPGFPHLALAAYPAVVGLPALTDHHQERLEAVADLAADSGHSAHWVLQVVQVVPVVVVASASVAASSSSARVGLHLLF